MIFSSYPSVSSCLIVPYEKSNVSLFSYIPTLIAIACFLTFKIVSIHWQPLITWGFCNTIHYWFSVKCWTLLWLKSVAYNPMSIISFITSTTLYTYLVLIIPKFQYNMLLNLWFFSFRILISYLNFTKRSILYFIIITALTLAFSTFANQYSIDALYLQYSGFLIYSTHL